MTAAMTSKCCAGPVAASPSAMRRMEVKAAADDVTKTIDDGGPAAELREWFG